MASFIPHRYEKRLRPGKDRDDARGWIGDLISLTDKHEFFPIWAEMETEDEITRWLGKSGRKALDLEAARQLAAESPEHWYVAAHGSKGFLVGKMTMQKFSQRHILLDEAGQPLLFATSEGAVLFLRSELKITRPHVFNY